MDKKAIILICMGIVIVLLTYIYFSFNNLIDDYNDLVDDNRDLDKSNNEKRLEIENNKLLMKYNQEHITNLRELIEKLYIKNDKLTTEIKEKEKEYNTLYEEYFKYNDFVWTGCSDSRTVIKFCKGCDWDLVCSGSMKPTFSCENTLYFCRARKDEIKIGDIIAFSTPEYENEDYETFYTIHRVVGISPDGKYITKGDANIEMDSFEVPFKNIRGKLWRVDG